jgi:hypothetical protein
MLITLYFSSIYDLEKNDIMDYLSNNKINYDIFEDIKGFNVLTIDVLSKNYFKVFSLIDEFMSNLFIPYKFDFFEKKN